MAYKSPKDKDPVWTYDENGKVKLVDYDTGEDIEHSEDTLANPKRAQEYFKNLEYFKWAHKGLGDKEASRVATIRAQQVDMLQYGANEFNSTTAKEKLIKSESLRKDLERTNPPELSWIADFEDRSKPMKKGMK